MKGQANATHQMLQVCSRIPSILVIFVVSFFFLPISNLSVSLHRNLSALERTLHSTPHSLPQLFHWQIKTSLSAPAEAAGILYKW